MNYPRLSLKEFVEIYHKVPRAGIDIIVKSKEGILLTKRLIPPFEGFWHIPGGTILFKEPIKHAIDRISQDELGIKVNILRWLGVIEYFNDGGRHTISNAFLVEIKEGSLRGSRQGKQINFYKKLPKNCILEQKEFLQKHKLV